MSQTGDDSIFACGKHFSFALIVYRWKIYTINTYVLHMFKGTQSMYLWTHYDRIMVLIDDVCICHKMSSYPFKVLQSIHNRIVLYTQQTFYEQENPSHENSSLHQVIYYSQIHCKYIKETSHLWYQILAMSLCVYTAILFIINKYGKNIYTTNV